jgi:hypothetical protein
VSQDQQLQQQRVELNYVVSEQRTRRISDYASYFVKLGKTSVGKSDGSHAVHGLCVDSDHRQTYSDTLNGNKHPFKLRICPRRPLVDCSRVATGAGALETAVNLGNLRPGESV